MNTVLHLIETTGIGGAERVLLDIARTLDRGGWRNLVVVPSGGWLLDHLREEHVDALELGERGSFDFGFLRRVVQLARRERADVIHGHLFGSAVRAGLVSRLTGIASVGTIHGAVDLSAKERNRALKLAVIRHGLRRVVFVSEPLRESCLAAMHLARDRTMVIPNGVDIDAFTPGTSPQLRDSLGISAEDFVVGSVGRLQPVKGLSTLLEAAAILKQESPRYRFVIVGVGDERYTRELVELRSRLGLTGEVTFLGVRSDVNWVMRAFDVYALTSRSEGFSLSTVEAMASGVPVVATRCGGPEQILENGALGLLVENGSAGAVAGAIEQLRRNAPERRQIAERARRAVVARFTVAAQVGKYETLYKQLIDSRRLRGG